MRDDNDCFPSFLVAGAVSGCTGAPASTACRTNQCGPTATRTLRPTSIQFSSPLTGRDTA